MVDGRIAAVVLPAVSRIARGELRHEIVPRHLRDDGRRRYRERPRIALDHLGVLPRREGRVEDAATVDEDVVVLADLPERALHGDVARVIDVQPVDLRD